MDLLPLSEFLQILLGIGQERRTSADVGFQHLGFPALDLVGDNADVVVDQTRRGRA